MGSHRRDWTGGAAFGFNCLSGVWLHYAFCLLWEMGELGPCPLPSAFQSLDGVGTPPPPALQFILAFAG